jgi:hypothetical protein
MALYKQANNVNKDPFCGDIATKTLVDCLSKAFQTLCIRVATAAASSTKVVRC